MIDNIKNIGNSVLQHGKYNDRIYLMKFDPADQNDILSEFERLSQEFKYSKIFMKINGKYKAEFLNNGFRQEASIPRFFSSGDCVFLSRFFNTEREILSVKDEKAIRDILFVAKSKSDSSTQIKVPQNYSVRILSSTEIEELALLYRSVFDSYPFPIFHIQYLAETMQDNVVYFGCFHGDKLVAASSSEIDEDTMSVEMTDFATTPEFRGQNLSLVLLLMMESEMKRRDIRIFYTIARSLSFGMNITFSKSGYEFGGTLVNNTNISGSIESMNVWYKHSNA